jgi:mRNA deadenylase 3'-5' endonuclease subunit Ccr4
MHTLESTRLAKFSYCKPGALLVSKRIPLICKTVNEHRPDIACFQEVDGNLARGLGASLNASLQPALFEYNTNVRSKDGIAIYIDADKFAAGATRVVRFSDSLDKYFPSLKVFSDSTNSPLSLTRALYRETREKLNMVGMVRLTEKSSGRELVACSSHLFWDPAYPDIKLIQAYILAKEVLEFSCTTPSVIGADLNSTPDTSAVYKLLMGDGHVPVSHEHHPVTLRSSPANRMAEPVEVAAMPSLTLETPFSSAMKIGNGGEPPFTNYTKSFKGCLDYIMIKGLSVSGVHPLPNQAELSVEGALPNSFIPSDHLPLVVDLEFQ